MLKAIGLVSLLLTAFIVTGCSGADEGNYTGPTETFKDAANKPAPEGKKGGPGLVAEP